MNAQKAIEVAVRELTNAFQEIDCEIEEISERDRERTRERLSFLSGKDLELTEQETARYEQILERHRSEQQYDQRRVDALEKRQTEINEAIKRMEAIGYALNITK